MQESSSYAVGLDIGSTKVRAVVAHVDGSTGIPTIVGIGQAVTTGMRKGVVANLQGPGQAIDAALGDAERMSGYQVHGATISINGAHILTTPADGMVAVGASDHEITPDDLERIKDVATLGKVPANREIIDVIAHAYKLDGQDNIKDPLGMTGTRLEIDAHVISALTPYIANLDKVAELAQVQAHGIVPTAMAAARAVLSESQLENGAAVIDMGGTTTSVAVYEEGDLQFVGVVPIGGANITNDLAIGLKTDPEIAEEVKIKHACALSHAESDSISLKYGGEIHTFKTADINEIVEARLEEIFEAVQRELKRAGRAGKLPSGVILTGGASKLKHITDYAKEVLGLAARLGQPTGYGGVADDIDKSEYATAIGLMLIDADFSTRGGNQRGGGKKSGGGFGTGFKVPSTHELKGKASKLFGWFKP